MSHLAIRVQGLGKQYKIGSRERYRTVRDALTETVSSPFRRARSLFKGRGNPETSANTFWALLDISFEVPQGAVVGVIGRNGAGKSTLLKVLARIAEPTTGRAEIHGRVGSLLEVGTGFHPELTGRENVFLNGAILGMKRAEISRKFDEIVDFAEVHKFIDTPVKRYSSGMYMRLAFAVAAHLEPEILIVDEVLAVGDVQFQKKCIGKMGDVARSGRTVLFVSHNLSAVDRLCSRSLLLDSGRLAAEGVTRDVISKYLEGAELDNGMALHARTNRVGNGDIRFTQIAFRGLDAGQNTIRAGEPFTIRLRFACFRRVANPVFSIAIFATSGECLFGIRTTDLHFDIAELDHGGSVTLTILNPNLLPGRYVVHCAVGSHHDPHCYDHVEDAALLDLQHADVYETGTISAAAWSNIYFDCQWALQETAVLV